MPAPCRWPCQQPVQRSLRKSVCDQAMPGLLTDGCKTEPNAAAAVHPVLFSVQCWRVYEAGRVKAVSSLPHMALWHAADEGITDQSL
jgi:hypothetical protein